MEAGEAAKIFHDWAFGEGLMPNGPASSITATPTQIALIKGRTDQGKIVLRNKQVEAIIANDADREIYVVTKRAAPTSKKALEDLPFAVGDVTVKYWQGGEVVIGGGAAVPYGGPAFSVRNVGGADTYTCGSSVSVGNHREAGTLGCLVRDGTGVMFGLSNNHVTGSCNFAQTGQPVLAPGVLDAISGSTPFTIGYHQRSLPLHIGSPDNVNWMENCDAATFRIRDDSLVSSFQGSAYDTPATAAAMVGGMEVEKVGRTTGHTRGKVLGQYHGAFAIKYNISIYEFSGLIYFDSPFGIVGDTDAFSDGGDSGSIITTVDAQGNRSAVGIIVGGRADGAHPGGRVTIALPLLPILQQFGVSLVSGHNV